MLKINKIRLFPQFLAIVLMMVISLTGFATGNEQILVSDELVSTEQSDHKTVQVEIGDFEKETTGKAAVYYLMKRSLYWENNTAYFKEVRVERGQEVKAGDVLMVFETEENLVELETLRLKLTRTKEDTEEQSAEKLEEINAAKFELDYLQGYDLQIAELKIEKMQAAYEQFMYQKDKELRQLQKQIDEINKAAEKNVLTAPFDGVISDVVKLYEGDQVAKGRYLISMYAADRLLLKADDSMEKLRYNMEVTVELGKTDDLKQYQGKVIVAPNILPSAVSNNLTLIELYDDVSIDELSGNIKYSGITESAYNVLYVPRKAVQWENSKEYVYLLDGDSIRRRYIKIALDTTEGMWVLEGLYEGQTLIVD